MFLLVVSDQHCPIAHAKSAEVGVASGYSLMHSSYSNNRRFRFDILKDPLGIDPVNIGDLSACDPTAIVNGQFFSYDDFADVDPNNLTSKQAVQQVIATRGASLSSQVWGHYSGVFLDVEDAKAVCVRDPVGGRTLYHARVEQSGLDLFSDSFSALCRSLAGSLTIDRKLIGLRAAVGSAFPTRMTGFTEIKSLLPGECLTCDFEQGVSTSWLPWWDRLAESSSRAPDLFDCLKQVITCWARVSGRISLQLSGGLDSSGMLGVLYQLGLGDRVECLSYFSPSGSSDERRHVRIAAAHVGADVREINVADLGFSLDLPEAYRFTERPSIRVLENRTESAFDEVATSAGCSTHWLGYGGDPIFINDPESYLIVDALQRRGLATAALTARELALFLETSIWRPVINALTFTERAGSAKMWLENFNLSDSRSVRIQQLQFETETFSLLDGVIGRLHAPGEKRRLLDVYHDVFTTAEATPFHTAGGLGYIRPYLSEPFIAAALGIPTFESLRFGLNRYPQRELVHKVMPNAISQRVTKGGGDDYLIRAMLSILPEVKRRIGGGSLLSEGLIDSEELIFEESDIGLATSKSIRLAGLLAIEAWLSGHSDVARL